MHHALGTDGRKGVWMVIRGVPPKIRRWDASFFISPEVGSYLPGFVFTELLGHSITYRIAVGPQQGRKVSA